MRALLVTTVLALTVLPGCGPGAATYMGMTAEQAAAAQQVTFIATRTFRDYVGTSVGWYKERFVQGQDNTRVDLLELNGLTSAQSTSPEQIQAFQRFEKRLAAGLGDYVAKMRDFRVRDLELFDQNYTYVVFQTEGTIAGRATYVADVKPKVFDRPWYTVWVDKQTLITLKYLEFLPSGALASEMETLSIVYNPDLSQEVFLTPDHTGLVELGQAQAVALAGFEVFAPNYLPAGFVFESAQLSRINNSDMIVFSYIDGVQQLFFVQYDSIDPNAPADTDPNVTVSSTQYGALCDARLVLLGTQLHLSCKVDHQELSTVIEHLDVMGY